MKIFLFVLLTFSIFLAGCAGPPADQPKATTNNTSTTNAASPANTTGSNGTTPAAKGEALQITPANSTIAFVGYKVTGRHQGGFTMFDGVVDLVNGKPEESSVSVNIDTNTLFADDPKLTDHLKSPDFFDVAKFPKATFKSTKIEAGAKEPNNYTITGDLDLHGIKKSIQFPAKIDVTDNDVTVKVSFRLNRKDFGMMYPGKADDLINDDVSLLLDVKAPRKK